MTSLKSASINSIIYAVTVAVLVTTPCLVLAQNNAPPKGQPQTVSVSPYARNTATHTPTSQPQHVLRLPANYQKPVQTMASKTGSLPQPQRVLKLPPHARMPATASLTPTTVPKTPVPVAAQKPPLSKTPAIQNLSIADVIDGVMKDAPDMPKIASLPPPAETIKPMAAEKPPLLSVATPETTAGQAAKARQPSKQDIAKLGDDKPRFYWPLRGNVVSTYGDKGSGKKNDGVNISAPKGTAVRSAAAGLVVYSGQDLGGLGNLVLIRHSGGYHTAYAHVDNVLVQMGDKVSAGEAIANVGKTGNVIKPQLHFEIRNGKKPVDPSAYLPQA